MSKPGSKLLEEVGKLVPPTLFFFVALHLVALLRSLMLAGTGVTLGTTASIAIASLVIGKAVLIADILPFVDRFRNKPLILNIAWKSLIYMVLAMLFHYLERIAEFWREADGFLAVNEKLLAEIVWPHFWAVQIFVSVLILMYCTAREVTREVGEQRMQHLMFGSRRAPSP